MMRIWGKLWRAAALLLVCSISSPQATQALDRSLANSVWVSETEGAIWLSSTDGSIQADIPGFTNVRGASLDVRRETLWLLADRSLSAFDLSGNLRFSIPLSVPDSSHAALTVVPSSGTVWLGVGHDLLNVSGEGELLGSFKLSSDAVAFGIDEQRSLLWAGTDRSAEARDLVTGVLVNTISLAPSERLHDLSVELSSGRIWIAVGDEARLYRSDGTLASSSRFKGLQRVSAAPDDTAWLADQKTIARLSATGSLERPFEPLGGKGTIEHLVVSGQGTVWVASQNAIARVSSDAESVDRISFNPPIRIWDLATNTDWISPALEIASPAEHACLSESTPSIDLTFSDRGWGVDSSTLQIFTDQIPVTSSCTTAAEGASCRVLDPLPDGELSLEAIVEDYAGNLSAPSRRTVVIDTVPPQIFVTEPPDGSVVGEPEVLISGTVSEPAELSIAGVPVALGEDLTFSDVEVSLEEGPNEIEITTVDCAGNTSHRTLAVTYSPGSSGGLPPDPATVAPPLDPTVPTQLSEEVRFLYEGKEPIQVGVEPGTIDPARAAVIRGRVLRRDGAPLPGVEIRVHSHPELGETLSREDGAFDLAVNGGARLTLSYSKHGYLPVHRQVQTTWRDYVTVEDVVLVAYDEEATAISMDSPEVQVAKGSASTDTDGTRQAVLIVPAGTTADLVLPDGTTQSVSSLTVRATEYTVGPRGAESMPAPLPPTSGYTYAVDLSADEALTVGATSVTFNQPVYHYVENFLGFPVGGAVPAGYYDRELAVWIPSENGRIVRVLDVIDGRALLDVDGSGVAATSSELADLHISDGELDRLGALYAAGQSLWRTPIPHFTPWDCNWPYGPPDDAEEPPEPDAQKPDPKDEEKPEEMQDDDDPAEDEDDPACEAGSVIECENQALGETIPLVGTDESLHYRSNRVPGRRVANVMKVRLSGRSVPASLDRIELRIEIAGQQIRRTFVAAANQSYTFTWNGKDAYGRVVQGRRLATARVGYVYRAVYYEPGRFTSSFGEVSPRTQIIGDRENLEVTLWRSSGKMLGTNLAMMAGLGGWTLSDHHIYQGSVTTRELYRGDGSMQIDGAPSSFDALWESENEGRVLGSYGLAAAPDGGFYYVDLLSRYPAAPIFRVQKMGAGGQRQGAVFLWNSNGVPQVQVGPNGDVYVATCSGFVWGYIWNLTTGELWSSQGTGCFDRFLVAPDGSFYYGREELLHRRRDGSTTSVFSSPAGRELAFRTIDRQGRIYVAVWATNRVWRIDPDGSARVVAGTGVRGFSGDGGPATQARLDFPEGLTVAPDGSLLIVDNGNARIRRVSQSGTITTIIGSGSTLRATGPVHPLAAGLSFPLRVIATPDGRVVVGDSSGTLGAILQTSSPFPGRVSVGQAAVVSQKRSEVFIFDSTGRHLRTLNALTGAMERSFDYDVNGRLVSLSDAFGNQTRIERDTSGTPTAIIAPFGQRTELTVDAEGYLASVTNPAGESYRFEYGNGGLLRSITDPVGHEKTAQYSTLGRLVGERDAAGGTKTLRRWRHGAGRYRVELTTAEGRTTTYSRDHTAGSQERRSTSTEGIEILTSGEDDGSRSTLLPSGTSVRTQDNPDARFGFQKPVAASRIIETPSGLRRTETVQQEATLVSPEDPFSLTTLRTSWSVNGREGNEVLDMTTGQATSVSPMGRTVVTVLDEHTRPLIVQPPNTAEIRYTYDSHGRLAAISQGEGIEERTLSLSYDDRGQLSKVLDPLNREIRFEYDDAGRLVGQSKPNGPIMQLGYDANGNVTSVTPPGQPSHLFRYISTNSVDEYEPPALDNLSTATQYRYDLDHRLVSVEKADGKSVNISYDTSGRIRRLTHSDDSMDFTYDGQTGQLVSIEGSDTSISYGYDGALLTRTSWDGLIQGVINNTYDNNFFLSSRSVNGSSITFDRDADGFLTRSGVLAIFRDAKSGRVSSTSIGSLTSTVTYNPFGELASIGTRAVGSPLFSATFDRDKLGRITKKTENVSGTTVVFDYDYDPVGRLRGVYRNGTLTEDYRYNENGDRISAEFPWGKSTATYDSQDRVITSGDVSFTFTRAGALATRTEAGSTTTLSYDVLGNLRRVDLPSGEVIEYVIDGHNRRIGKKVDTVLVEEFLYKDSLNPVAILDSSGAILSRFVYGTRANVPDYMVREGHTYRMISDHLGSVRLVVEVDTGSVAQRLDYDAFGRVLVDTNPGFQPFGFGGGLYDPQTGLVHFGHRDYDATSGRWTTRDPSLFQGEGTNLYAYVGNDPVNWTDPTGLHKGDKTFGLSKRFWKWYHRQVKEPGDPDLTRDEALDLHDEWEELGEPDPEGKPTKPNPDSDHPEPSDPQQYCSVDPAAAPTALDIGEVLLGAGIIAGTLAEDLLTGGAGLLDDPVTVGIGVGLILGSNVSPTEPPGVPRGGSGN